MDFGEGKVTLRLVEIELRSFCLSALGLVPVPNGFAFLLLRHLDLALHEILHSLSKFSTR